MPPWQLANDHVVGISCTPHAANVSRTKAVPLRESTNCPAIPANCSAVALLGSMFISGRSAAMEQCQLINAFTAEPISY